MDVPNLEWLRKQAKQRLSELRKTDPSAKLAQVQLALAREAGFPSWRALKAHVESLTLEGRLFAAARSGDIATLTAMLDEQPDRLHARDKPYEWTLLHAAAQGGHLAIVELLLRLGLHPNTKEKGDDTSAMHWAAAGGHSAVVRRLADAGGDVVGHGDDHELEVIGWATCWDGCDDDAHRAVVAVLLERGARHHIFSAIAMNLGDEVRRIVAADPSQLNRRMSRNEAHQLPLHFAIRKNRPEMVALLLELGADPLATDGDGAAAAAYAATAAIDRSVLEMLRARGAMDLFTTLAVGDWSAAESLWRAGSPGDGALHLLAKRGNGEAVRWLLAHGADPNALWSHWGARVTPLHLAAWQGHADVVRALLDAGADPSIHDSMHDSDVPGWAEHAGQTGIVEMLKRLSP